MQAPRLYTLKELRGDDINSSQVQDTGGKWVPARPVHHTSLRRRLKLTWMVFTGKADVFTWPCNQ